MFRSCLLTVVVTCLASGAFAQGLINEFQPNPPGTDPDPGTIEILGVPTTAFSGWVVSIESDAGSPGIVDRASTVSGTFDANGLLTVPLPDLENPSFTVVLMDTFTGTVGVSDVDPANDGIVEDTSFFGTVYDAIGVPDIVGDEAFIYGAQLGGTDLAYSGDEPEICFRDGLTVANIFVVNLIGDNTSIRDAAGLAVPHTDFDFDPSVATTFGAVNPVRVIPVELMGFSVE